MDLADIAYNRLISQQIKETDFKTAKDIVSWMGAMQAQDYVMAKWALGVRLPGATDKIIETAINQGEIIRTHVLRPTWHFVSADDIYWMLNLTAPRIKSSLKSRHKELELNDTVFNKSYNIIEKALIGGKHLLRKELLSKLEDELIYTANQRGSHLLLQAELNGIICSGVTKGRQTTYALLQERVHKTIALPKDEALAKLAYKYFTSHAPATLQDFVWWSGLSITDAKNALDMIKSNFIHEEINSQLYWFTNSSSIIKDEKQSAFLLPAFDEFIISYKNRSASLPSDHHSKAVSNNGIFWPIIVVNGQIKGIWKRHLKKNQVCIELHFFEPPTKATKYLIERRAAYFAQFLNQKIEIAI